MPAHHPDRLLYSPPPPCRPQCSIRRCTPHFTTRASRVVHRVPAHHPDSLLYSPPPPCRPQCSMRRRTPHFTTRASRA
eukprot:166739-Chlamydomonas_euryale.AAC.1